MSSRVWSQCTRSFQYRPTVVSTTHPRRPGRCPLTPCLTEGPPRSPSTTRPGPPQATTESRTRTLTSVGASTPVPVTPPLVDPVTTGVTFTQGHHRY